MLPFVTLREKVSAQAYPRDFVHLVYLYIRAQGLGGQHNTRIKTAVFFVSVPFFLTQVRQVKVVFLRTLRNAATRLVTTVNYGVRSLSLHLPELKTRHLRESLFQLFLEKSRNVGR